MSGFQCIEERDGVRCTGKPWRGQERCEPCREKREAILNRRIVVPVPKRAGEQVLPSRDEMAALAAGSAEVALVRPKYIGLMSEAAALTLKNLEEKREEQRMSKQQAAAVKVTPPEAPEVKVELKQAPEPEARPKVEVNKESPLRSKQERFDFLATLGSEFTPADVGDRFGCGPNGTLHWLLDHTVRTRPGFYRLPKPGEKVNNLPRKQFQEKARPEKTYKSAIKPKKTKVKKASKPTPAPALAAPKAKAPYAQVCDLLEQLTPIELRGVRRLAKDRIAKRAAILKAELGELEAELGGQDASLTHGSVAALPRESVLPVERAPMDNENQ